MTPEQRHRCMSNIRGKDTLPELKVRQWLWKHGYRYRLHVKSVPGKPDIVMRTYRTAIFVNGCFWHGHQGCSKFRIPKSNTAFWKDKIERNRKRDIRNYTELHNNGWHVIVIWECQITPHNIEKTMLEVSVALNENLLSQYRPTQKQYDIEPERTFSHAAEESIVYNKNEKSYTSD